MLHFKLSQVPYNYLSTHHPLPEAMTGGTVTVKGMGKHYNCAPRTCVALFASSSSPRWGADECRLMILGVGGICQKSYLLLLPPSNVVGVCPLGLRRLGHLLSIWFFLPRLLTPRRVNPWVEWMLSFLWVLFGSFWRLHALPTLVVDLWRRLPAESLP